MQALLFLLWFF